MFFLWMLPCLPGAYFFLSLNAAFSVQPLYVFKTSIFNLFTTLTLAWHPFWIPSFVVRSYYVAIYTWPIAPMGYGSVRNRQFTRCSSHWVKKSYNELRCKSLPYFCELYFPAGLQRLFHAIWCCWFHALLPCFRFGIMPKQDAENFNLSVHE